MNKYLVRAEKHYREYENSLMDDLEELTDDPLFIAMMEVESNVIFGLFYNNCRIYGNHSLEDLGGIISFISNLRDDSNFFFNGDCIEYSDDNGFLNEDDLILLLETRQAEWEGEKDKEHIYPEVMKRSYRNNQLGWLRYESGIANLVIDLYTEIPSIQYLPNNPEYGTVVNVKGMLLQYRYLFGNKGVA